MQTQGRRHGSGQIRLFLFQHTTVPFVLFVFLTIVVAELLGLSTVFPEAIEQVHGESLPEESSEAWRGEPQRKGRDSALMTHF